MELNILYIVDDFSEAIYINGVLCSNHDELYIYDLDSAIDEYINKTGIDIRNSIIKKFNIESYTSKLDYASLNDFPDKIEDIPRWCLI